MSESPPVMEAMPVALSIPTVPIVRPIIGTNTYRQVCKKNKNIDVPVKGLKLKKLPCGSVFAFGVFQMFFCFCSGSTDFGSTSCQFCRASTSLCCTR